jgi:conjugal transfer mating pair stabilization protein TraG
VPDIYATDLLNVIAKGESRGNYNAYFGNVTNTEVQFTAMTVAEVLQWQEVFIAQGNASSAVGRYQFINTTLQSLVDQQRIERTAKFDEGLQDRLAIGLLERRGVLDYLNDRISRDEFARNLSMEWAALPQVIGENPTASYYSGDGLNAVQVSIEEVYKGIETVREL